MKISIIIPVYNEEKTVGAVIEKVQKASFGFEADREIIVINDGSHDNTSGVLKAIRGIHVIDSEKNEGKGASLKKGFFAITGDIVLTQDADFEYDVGDYPKLLAPIVGNEADVVFGNRFKGEIQKVVYSRSYLGNKFLTWLSNVCTGMPVGDMEVGYKVFRKEVIFAIRDSLYSERFGIEPELAARVARQGPVGLDGVKGKWRLVEVPINYYGRTYKEGKKIGWWDGVKGIVAILYFNFFDRRKEGTKKS